MRKGGNANENFSPGKLNLVMVMVMVMTMMVRTEDRGNANEPFLQKKLTPLVGLHKSAL